jgi:hypothetical protein
MGDARRFNLFGKFIAQTFPVSQYKKVADIAGGKGYLQSNLREYGYDVTTYDQRHGRRNRPGKFQYRYQLFGSNIKESYDLLVGMHPDEATDVIIDEAAKRRVPFAICPCCVKPTILQSSFRDSHNYTNWISHLKELAIKNGYKVEEKKLRMTGKSLVLYGWPFRPKQRE